MLSYQHGYHAGNYADVIKHLTQVFILEYLVQKDKPLLYLDTHAGLGLYDLRSKQAQKTAEHKKGISLLWEQRENLPAVFTPFMKILDTLNPDGFLRYYPGSPLLALNILRPEDRVYCCELHPNEFEILSRLPHRHRRVHFSKSDGLNSLKALLPPLEKRACVFIDPSFECKEEYKKVPQKIKEAYQRFATGVYCLWYPCVQSEYVYTLTKGMQAIGAKYLHLSFQLQGIEKIGMYGCGLWILNPPYQLKESLETALKWLEKVLKGKATITEG